MDYIVEETLVNLGIRYAKYIQKPGDIIVTFSNCYHQIINLGLCLNSAVNFLTGIKSLDLPVLSWKPCGKR